LSLSPPFPPLFWWEKISLLNLALQVQQCRGSLIDTPSLPPPSTPKPLFLTCNACPAGPEYYTLSRSPSAQIVGVLTYLDPFFSPVPFFTPSPILFLSATLLMRPLFVLHLFFRASNRCAERCVTSPALRELLSEKICLLSPPDVFSLLPVSFSLR